MKTTFLSFIFISIVFIGFSQPKIEFETETVDYGTIVKGEDGVRDFKFTNTGDSPLIINQVRSSCGCTIPKKPSEPIPPGASNYIQVKYDTSRLGPIRKTITVTSNADRNLVALKIKGEVVE